MDRLQKLRDRIDWLDAQIASLLDERMKATDEVGNIKRTRQQEVLDPSREQRVLAGVKAAVQHPVLKENIGQLYAEIIREARVAQQFFQHPSQPFRRIGIVGLGLMGGSICKGIKIKDPSIHVGVLSYAAEDDALAQTEGWVDAVYANVGDLVQHCDLVILASPISTIVELSQEIRQHGAKVDKLVVIDIASVKQEIVEAFCRLTCDNIEYIGTHPMAGREKSGLAHSLATLFVQRPWIVVPHQYNSTNNMDKIKAFILFLGAEPVYLDADVHDRQVALVSHLPSILSKAFFDFARTVDPESTRVAGPGYEGFTRLAHGNADMRQDIAYYNRKAIREHLDRFIDYITETTHDPIPR